MKIPNMLLTAVLLLTVGCASTSGTRGDLKSCAEIMPARPSGREMSAQEAMTPPASAVIAVADNPTTTDPDKYQAVMENEHVRVLRYHDTPGAKTHQHAHPDSLLYALSAFRRRLIFPDGTIKERDFKEGDVMWVPAQTHIGENIGQTETEVVLIEMK